MKKCLASLLLACLSLFLSVGVLAQTLPAEAESATTGLALQAVISAQEAAAAGEAITFSAAHSHNPFPERPVVYSWSFGDSYHETGEEIIHKYAKAGAYEVELTMKVGTLTEQQKFPILIYDDTALLVAGNANYTEQIKALFAAAREQNIFLEIAWVTDAQEGLLARESIVARSLQDKLTSLQKTRRIILWTNPSDGLNGLAQLGNKLDQKLDFSAKQIVVVAQGDLEKISILAHRTFAKIHPAQIILTSPEGLRSIVLSPPQTDLPGLLKQQSIAYRLIDSGLEPFHLFAPLSFLVNYLVVAGIPDSVILLVLLLPVIATIVAFTKQVVGIATFGVYTPSVLTLSFLTIGLRLGLVVLAVVVFASLLTRRVLRRYRLAYTPRLAIVLTVVSLAILGAIVLLTKFAPLLGGYSRTTDLIAASIFPMLIMSTLAEKFVSIQTEKGSSSAIRLFLELMFISVLCYLVVGKWEYLQTLLLVRPEIILLFLLVDVVLGRFTGLRVTEYFRFREVLKREEEE